jgi:putative endonuclease
MLAMTDKRGAMRRPGYVYILTNKGHSTLYTGVTSDLVKRVYEHRAELVDSFTKRYKLTKLIYYEIFDEIENAIAREKQLKGGSRAKKLQLINGMNPDWKDLYEEL